MTRALTDPDLAPLPPGPPRWDRARLAWEVSAYADVQAVLGARGMAPPPAGALLARVEARTGCPHPHLSGTLDGTMLFQSGPRHAGSRQAVRLVLARAAAHWTGDSLRTAADGIAATLPEDAVLDAAATLADRLPCRVAADLLGLAEARVRLLRASSQQVTAAWRPVVPLRDFARLEALCAQVHAELDADPALLPEGTAAALDYPVAALVQFLVIAAIDSTASTIAAGLDLLARDPALQDRLRAQPALVDGFVFETLRLAGPLRRLNDRIAAGDTAIGGVDIPAGSAIILQVDRAHRDAAAYPDPHRIDPLRTRPTLLAFGAGAHACQGGVLGQDQVAAMLAAMLARFAITPAEGPRALAADPILRRFDTLPLRLARIG